MRNRFIILIALCIPAFLTSCEKEPGPGDPVDISTNTSLGSESAYGINSDLDISDMPDLSQVCVWTLPFPPNDLYVYSLGSPNVYYTTECSR